MIFIILFIALLIFEVVNRDRMPYIDPVNNDAERRRLMAIIDQWEYDMHIEREKAAKQAQAVRMGKAREQINEVCRSAIKKLTLQFEAGELTQDEYDEGVNALLDEMKINLSS